MSFFVKSFFLIAFSVLLVVSHGFGQMQHRFSAGIGVGPSIPLGTYASKVVTDPSSGWAQTGVSLSLRGTYQINKLLGVTVVAGGQMNKASESAFKESIFLADGTIEDVNASIKSWQVAKLMGGADVHFFTSGDHKITLKAGALAGVAKVHEPGYSYTASRDINGTSTVFLSGKADGYKFPWTFCYNVNAGAAFRLSKIVSLTATASYFHTSPALTIRFYNSDGQVERSIDIKYPVTSLNVEAGIEIQL